MREATFLKKSFPPRPLSKDFYKMAPPAHEGTRIPHAEMYVAQG